MKQHCQSSSLLASPSTESEARKAETDTEAGVKLATTGSTAQCAPCTIKGTIDTAPLLSLLPTLDLPHQHPHHSNTSRRLEEWSLAVLFTLLPPTVVVKILSLLLLEQSLVVCGTACGPGQWSSRLISTHRQHTPSNIPYQHTPYQYALSNTSYQ